MGIEVAEDLLPLSHDVVRHDEHVLPRDAAPAHLHGGSNHDVGLAGAYIEGKQRIGLCKDSLHGILLVGEKGHIRRKFGQFELGAIVGGLLAE